MFCFCSIKSWTFSSLNKFSVGFSQLWASPAGGGKSPSKQVWSPCSWYPGEINPPKQHSWNTELNVSLWKALDKPAVRFLCCASGCRAQDNAGHSRWAGAEQGRSSPGPAQLLFGTLLLLQRFTSPALFLLCSQGSRWGMSQTAGTANVPNLGRRCSCLMSPAVITAKWLKDFLKKASYL